MRASEFVTEQAVTEEINPDCFDPAFNDTQIFDGLTYRATVDQEYGKPVLTIRVLDDNFQQAGLAKFKQSTRGVTSLITSFRPEYQGQGLARNIYAYVRAMGNTIVPSRNQLPPGKAMWDSWKKSGDARYLMKDVEEGWKDRVTGAALAGAMALGGAGGTQAGNDSTNAGYHNLPDIVARITMTVNSKTIEKEINLGTQYQSPIAAKQAVTKWLEEKGVKNYTINLERVKSVDEGLTENFADGKNPQDKGDSKRHGINTKASVSSLRKTAKSGGRKGQLAHWLANMKSGRAKAKKKKTNETVIGNLHFPRLSIAVDDHAIDRTRTRGISPASIDQSLRKLNSIADQLGQMESSNTVWVYDVSNNLALGLRRTSSRDMRFTLKTVIAARPFDGPTPIIELT